MQGIVTGVMGVVFFVLNAIFALVLLILVLVSSCYAIFSKNPDTRYQPMRDDRASFIKSQTTLNNELDALGATARGDVKTGYKSRDHFDDDDSFTSSSFGPNGSNSNVLPPPSAAGAGRPGSQRDPPHSPVDPSLPLFPSDGVNRHGSPGSQSRGMFTNHNDSSRPGSDLPLLNPQGYGRSGSAHSNSPAFRSQNSGSPGPGFRQQNNGSPAPQFRQQNNASPWQRGAGYDH
jgi:hypothetical protein